MNYYTLTETEISRLNEHVEKNWTKYYNDGSRDRETVKRNIFSGKAGELIYANEKKEQISKSFFNKKSRHNFRLKDGTKVDVKTISPDKNKLYFKIDDWHNFDIISVVLLEEGSLISGRIIVEITRQEAIEKSIPSSYGTRCISIEEVLKNKKLL